MIDVDAAKFEDIIHGLFEALGYPPPTRTAKRLWWQALKHLELEQLSRAATKFLVEHKERPTVAQILTLAISKAFPTPEEGWNMAPKSESDSAFVFTALARALAACQDSLLAGDRIGARKCFLEVYEREVRNSPLQSPDWWISDGVGLTQEQREQARLDLMETHPERTTPEKIAHQRLRLETATGSTRSETPALEQIKPSGLLQRKDAPGR